MYRIWFALTLSVLALAITLTTGVQAADEATPVMQEEKLPAADAFKNSAGSKDGHKTPIEVVSTAIKAAKDGKMDVLKACFAKDCQDNLDKNSYYKQQDIKYIDAIATIIAGFDTAKLKEYAQTTVGRYAIVMHFTESTGMRLIRVIYERKNWVLQNYSVEDYLRDYSAGLKALRETIESGNGAKLKEYLDDYEAMSLSLLAGVQEGADPYDLLAKKLKKLSTSEGGPSVFLCYGWSGELAYWFRNPKAAEKEPKDGFVVIRTDVRFDWEKKEYYSEPKIALSSTARFAMNQAQTFKGWVSDYPVWEPDEKDEKKEEK